MAALARLSLTWYTWLEQGRDVHASARTLENLSAVLRLSMDEREYLFALAHNRPAPFLPAQTEVPHPSVLRMLKALETPALIMSNRWDVVAWNRLVTLLFRDYGAMQPQDRNLARILLTSPEYQRDPVEYRRIARRVVAKLRIDYSCSAGDPMFRSLIDDLNATCPIFHKLWHGPEIAGRSEGRQIVIHPELGSIGFEHTSYRVEGSPNLCMIVFTPNDADDSRKLHELVSRGWNAGQPRLVSESSAPATA